MKPKNKFQAQIVQASKTLPKLTPAQIKWGFDNTIEPIAHRTEKGVMTCTECNHSWQGEGHLVTVLTDCICPQCHTKLKVEITKKRSFKQLEYMTVITAHKGYQVIRTVQFSYTVKLGYAPKYNHHEVMQRWITPDGKYCTFALLRQTMGNCYIDSWLYNTDLELREASTNNKFCINIYDSIYVGMLYPRMRLIPEIKRTGFKGDFLGQKPKSLFCALLSDSRAETLLKTGNSALLKRMMDGDWKQIDKYWPSVRICIRNGYRINDAKMWCDYIELLRIFGKDLHNAKYVCPANLKAEHDRYVRKKAKADAQRKLEEQIQQEAKFREIKARFFGLSFSEGQIQVRVLESVADIIEEGKIMHHCVGSYHSREDSLILSASVDGKRMETVEVSISNLRVTQCRGRCNSNTEHHNEIVQLVERNMHHIRQRIAV